MINSTTIRVPEKYKGRIDEIFHDSDGYWCYLKHGWCWDDPGLHIIHEDTQKEVLRCIRETKRCNCIECKLFFEKQTTKMPRKWKLPKGKKHN